MAREKSQHKWVESNVNKGTWTPCDHIVRFVAQVVSFSFENRGRWDTTESITRIVNDVICLLDQALKGVLEDSDSASQVSGGLEGLGDPHRVEKTEGTEVKKFD